MRGALEAQVNLGICYNQGLGVPQDYAEAIKWFTSAAEADHPAGKMNLAISYYEGEGVEQNKEKAVALLTEAAEFMPDAQFLLAQCYANGEGTAVSYTHLVIQLSAVTM